MGNHFRLPICSPRARVPLRRADPTATLMLPKDHRLRGSRRTYKRLWKECQRWLVFRALSIPPVQRLASNIIVASPRKKTWTRRPLSDTVSLYHNHVNHFVYTNSQHFSSEQQGRKCREQFWKYVWNKSQKHSNRNWQAYLFSWWWCFTVAIYQGSESGRERLGCQRWRKVDGRGVDQSSTSDAGGINWTQAAPTLKQVWAAE